MIKKISPLPLLKSPAEYEKDREIKILEGFLKKKFSKDYIDKLSVLLHNSKNKTNYSKKRNNIKKTIYKLDNNNELYLTLPKLNIIKKKDDKALINNIGNIYTRTETTEYSNKRMSSKPSAKKYFDDEEDILDNNIKEILNDNEKGDKEKEEKGKVLFEKLKTRYDILEPEKSRNGKNDKNNKKKYKSLQKIKKKKIPSQYKLIATPQQISEFDYNLGRSFVNGNLKYLTKGQKEKLGYIAELNIFNSIDRLKEKNTMIKEMKYGEQNKKKILMPIDFFKYDEKKWKKISIERNKNYNDIAINELNDKNKEKLNIMREKINKLNVDAFAVDKEVNKTINNINYFLSKYGFDNESRSISSSSSKSIKYQNSKKREKKSSEEKKE